MSLQTVSLPVDKTRYWQMKEATGGTMHFRGMVLIDTDCCFIQGHVKTLDLEKKNRGTKKKRGAYWEWICIR